MRCWKRRTILEKKSLATIIFLVVALSALIALIMVYTERDYCQTKACFETSKHILASMNFHRNPCDNFYEFTCGNFDENKKYDTLSAMEHQILKTIKNTKDLVTESVRKTDAKSLRLQKKYYQSCIDLNSIENDNDKTFWGLIHYLGGWPVAMANEWNESRFDYVEMMVNLRKIGLQYDWFLDVTVSNNTIEVTYPETANEHIDNSTYDAYLSMISQIALKSGAPTEQIARNEMKKVIYFENKLATIVRMSKDKSESRDEYYKLSQVQESWQKINWIELLNQITKNHLTDDDSIIFRSALNYLPKLDKLLRETTKRTQVNYIIWKLIESYAPILSRKIRDETSTYQRKLPHLYYFNWWDNREDFCLEKSKNLFLFAVEAEFLRRKVPRDDRPKIEELIERIKGEMEKHLIKADWMDSETKKSALTKLNNMSFIIGGPEEMYYVEQFDRLIGGVDKMVDFSNNSSWNVVQITNEIYTKGTDQIFDLASNQNEASRLKIQFYGMVATMDVRFLRDDNIMYIPAGLLSNEIFYNPNRPNFLNFGTLGTIVGHEMTHGFDTGTFGTTQWWSNETSAKFEESIDCLLNRCNDFLVGTTGPSANITVDCRRSLLENMADFTGINLSFEAYLQWLKEKKERNKIEKILPELDFPPKQMFWVSYASLMCQSSEIFEEVLNGTKMMRNSHLLPSFRVLASYKNSHYFSDTFRCKAGSEMNPGNKCQIL